MPERRAAVARLGWLSLFDPMKPDGAYVMDLSSGEERAVAAMLVQLATREPGHNLVGLCDTKGCRECSIRCRAEAQFSVRGLPIPGWTVPPSWNRGLPKRGTLRLTYSSLGDGCEANWGLRRELRQHTVRYC